MDKQVAYKQAHIPDARLTLIVEFDELQQLTELEEIIEKAREYGTVKQATYETFKLLKKELV